MAGLAIRASAIACASRSSRVTIERCVARVALPTAAAGVLPGIPPAMRWRWISAQRLTPM